MTTVADMIEWMKTLPPDATVECGIEVTSGHQTYMRMGSVSIPACDVIDYRSESRREKYPAMAGRVIVMIQGE